MALHELRPLARDLLVWAAWTVLKGTPFHGKSFGDLRRLTPFDVARHLLPMAVALTVLAWFLLYMPPSWHLLYGVSVLIGVVSVGIVLSTTYALSWLLDRQLVSA